MIFYTYVLRSKKDGSVESIKGRMPLELEYLEACKNKEKAIKREKHFKSGFGRRFLKNRI